VNALRLESITMILGVSASELVRLANGKVEVVPLALL
jgi:hypothetical protein